MTVIHHLHQMPLYLLGILSSGGAIAPPLMPGFYRFLHLFLPPGAAVEIIRNAVYLRHAQHLEPTLVMAAWIVCLHAVLIFTARLGGRTPCGPASTRR
jgi:uncharacterized phage infection (PIP) family protein YhgE